MITPDYCITMARYSRWQNHLQLVAAERLDLAARQAPRGGVWGSIAGTLSHLLWGDTLWMSRFDGGEKPAVGQADSAAMFDDWDAWRRERQAMDARIIEWAKRLTAMQLDGDLYWFSASAGRAVSRPKALCVTHFFNHQTHHRGQVHAMLTAAGMRLGETDLILMPDDLDWM